MHFTEDNINKKLLSKEEINLLVNSAETKADRFYDLYVFLLHTGLRSGEARALTYDDFDWEKKTVSVNKTLAELKDGFQISPPKSRKSKRVIPLDDAIVEMLRRHKERQDRYKQCCQEIYQDRNIVFASETGDYERGQRVLVHFQRAMKRAGATNHHTIHHLRHSFCSILISSGANVKTVQYLMGHETADVTLGIYADLFAGEEAKAMASAVQCLKNITAS